MDLIGFSIFFCKLNKNWTKPRCQTILEARTLRTPIILRLEELFNKLLMASLDLWHFFKALTPAQKKIFGFDRELLAVYLSVKHFRCFLESRKFTISIDHKLLQFAFTAPRKNASAKQLRQINYIFQLNVDIKHTKGCDIPVANCLSRAMHPN